MMPIEETLWLPVCADAELPPGHLRAIRVLGQDRVVWRTADGRLSAAPDRCPHRGTPLSMGQVQGDRLVCPYHGWAFDIEGRCRHIPALAQVVPGARQAVACHAVRERHGLIWLRAGAPHESSLLAEPPPFDGPAEGTGIRRVLCFGHGTQRVSGILMQSGVCRGLGIDTITQHQQAVQPLLDTKFSLPQNKINN